MSKEIDNLSKQKHRIYINDDVVSELEDKLTINFRDKDNGIRGERAETLFRWVNRAIYNISNDILIDPEDRVDDFDYVYEMHDDIGTIRYFYFYTGTELSVCIKNIIWKYKNNKDSFYSVVDNKNATLTYQQKKSLYESIMRKVAVIVKQAIEQNDK